MEAKVDSWQVQVVANGEPVLTIGDNFLSSHNDVDEYATLIRNCAEHLLAFTGQSVIPCTYPDCLSARAVQAAGEEVEKLRGENANLRAAVNGFTFCHSDEAVMDEIGRLRVKVEEAYQRGVAGERERCVGIVQAGIEDCKNEGDRDGLVVLAYAKKAMRSAQVKVAE